MTSFVRLDAFVRRFAACSKESRAVSSLASAICFHLLESPYQVRLSSKPPITTTTRIPLGRQRLRSAVYHAEARFFQVCPPPRLSSCAQSAINGFSFNMFG